jgi:type 1 glutamine amidotransferase
MLVTLVPLGSRGTAAADPAATRSVLIVDGMNNHDWQRGTRLLAEILRKSGRFTVDVATSPPGKAPADQWQAWRPAFEKYDVVLMNFNGGHTAKGVHWPRPLEKALEDYVAGGGGLVVVHAANNSFPNWTEYNRMIGLGWRPREFGPSLVVGEDDKVIVVPQGEGRNPGHGPEHDFVVTVLDPRHPITSGLPKQWMHPHEQLTHGQHGPARDVTVLTCAYSRDTKEREVMDWVIPYGKGRVYTTMLGHLWKNGPDTAVRCAGFQTMLIRGTEWAATGQVTGPVPPDFPTAAEARLRPADEPALPQPPEGFKAVFNGRDLSDWQGSPEFWSVEEGCLTGKADGTLKYNRFIVWRGGTLRNFELRVKVKVSPRGNSGLQYRGTERPDLGESVVTGYQCDVVATRPDYNGMLYEERGRRILAHTGERVVIDPSGQPWVVGRFPLREFPPGEWHDYRVVVEGNHHRHWIDGQPTVDVVDLDPKGRKLEGVLAVQVHVGPPMTIQYRDVFLKNLPEDLPLLTPEQAVIPPDAPKVVPQGKDRPRTPDAR